MTIKVEIFSSPGCSKCGHARDVLRKLALELDGSQITWQEVNILEELDHAVSLGVLATPSIAINDELVFTSLPSAKKLRNELLRRLQKEKQS